jgi:hypothetical protein
MARWLAVPFLVLALAACESNKEREQDAVNYCKGFGFKPGTNGMDYCTQKYANEREQQFEEDSDAEMVEDDMMLMGPPCC